MVAAGGDAEGPPLEFAIALLSARVRLPAAVARPDDLSAVIDVVGVPGVQDNGLGVVADRGLRRPV